MNELTKAVEGVLKQARGAVDRSWKATLKALPDGSEKAVRDLSKRVDQMAKDLRKSRKDLTKRVEKTVNDIDRRGRRAFARVEKRGNEILGNAEERTAGALKPLAKRLDIASHSEVAALQKRLARVESKISSAKARPVRRRRAA